MEHRQINKVLESLTQIQEDLGTNADRLEQLKNNPEELELIDELNAIEESNAKSLADLAKVQETASDSLNKK